MLVAFGNAVIALALGRQIFRLESLKKTGYWCWEGLRQYLGLICGAQFTTTAEFFRISPFTGIGTTALVFAAWLSCNLLVNKMQDWIRHPERKTELMPHEVLFVFLIRRFRGTKPRLNLSEKL